MENWEKTLRRLPEDWRALAKKATRVPEDNGIRAIAAYMCFQLGEFETKEAAKRAWNILSTPFQRAQAVSNSSPKDALKAFVDINPKTGNPWSLLSIAEDLARDRKVGRFVPEPDPPPRFRRQTVTELTNEFVRMLSYESLAKAWKTEAARLHPDNSATGDAVRATRLNELWGKLETILGENI